MDTPRYFIGLMSGTSLDGVDAALVDLAGAPRLVETGTVPFPDTLRRELLALHVAGHAELHRAAVASNLLAMLYAKAVQQLIAQAGVAQQDIVAIGCHGQTVRHRPEEGYSLQLNNASLLAEVTGISVVSDFRSRDIAAGGHGAPLVPAFHAACFRDAARHCSIVNIGGIANVTALPPGMMDATVDTELDTELDNEVDTTVKTEVRAVTGFDTGPGNMLLDAWVRRHLGTDQDGDGLFAASGSVCDALLADCLADPYFAMKPPKSTGRDRFNIEWLLARIDRLVAGGAAALRPEDVQATLAELTVRSIAGAIERWCPQTQDVYVCGGGARNRDLMQRLATRLKAARKPVTVASTEQLGIHPDWVEAMAFAWLAARAVDHQPGNLPLVTGARGPRVLGAIHPA